jgi:superfamily II DNA or RNA helicase
MTKGKSASGGDLFIVDNSDNDWKVRNYLHEWADIANRFDIATGFFEIGALLSLDGQWQKLDKIRILMGDEVSGRTQNAFLQSLESIKNRLDQSIEAEKESNDFLIGAPAIVDALRNGQIHCRIYNKGKFHAKAYITHAKHSVIGPSALVGSSNFTCPGLTQNVELNVQLRREVEQLQDWYEQHWKDAKEISPEILKVIERHTRDYTPFEIYANSLQEYFKTHETSANDWEKNSKMYNVLARYQQDGYHSLLKIANKWDGALLCDGVGLGKTFIGLMLIERLIKYDGKRVALFVPKAARVAVWESKIKRYLPELLEGFYSFRIYNHTDLSRERIRFQMEQIRDQADVVIIDEAHHFRNTGIKGEKDPTKKSRYWRMYDVCESKQVYMLTATPINNDLTDLQHMIEMFSRNKPKHFQDAPLGIHSLSGHIRRMKNALKAVMHASMGNSNINIENIDLIDAQQVLSKDELFKNLVVQRSRSYVKKSLAEKGGEIPFPKPSPPQVVDYSVKQTYGKLLRMVEEAFHKKKPLFSLTMYYPWDYYLGSEEDLKAQDMAMQEGRQKQVVQLIRTSFLKRFESSVKSFEFSCRTLMKKLIAFYQVHANDKREQERLEKWLTRNKAITGHDPHKQSVLFEDDLEGEMIEEDIIEPEFFQTAREGKLKKDEFDLSGILADTMNDLDTIADFLKELIKFQPKQDKKLTALKNLLKNDKVLKEHKCLIFTEFKDTAKYLYEQLLEAGYTDIEEIDSDTNSNGRELLIKRFSPYYNESSSAELSKTGHDEIRLLISTDVLSEGLNLQDATRLINYDLHWNPVRLMQRIGRTDRRLDTQTEARMIADHPEMETVRGTIQYYNFLPPEELNVLLSLYNKVTHKTLQISKTFGIEGGKLLRGDDDYEMLKDFNAAYEGEETQLEKMHLEFQQLIKDNPELEDKLKTLPGKIFSGKQSPAKDTKAVFFCYGRPAKDAEGNWSIDAGDVCWYLYDIQTESIIEDATKIIDIVRSKPDTPRKCVMEHKTLAQIRKTIEKHIKNTYLKKIQGTMAIKPKLIAWMEIN